MSALVRICAKTLAISLACMVMLMVFTWAEEEMEVACQALFATGAALFALRRLRTGPALRLRRAGG